MHRLRICKSIPSPFVKFCESRDLQSREAVSVRNISACDDLSTTIYQSAHSYDGADRKGSRHGN